MGIAVCAIVVLLIYIGSAAPVRWWLLEHGYGNTAGNMTIAPRWVTQLYALSDWLTQRPLVKAPMDAYDRWWFDRIVSQPDTRKGYKTICEPPK